MKKTLAIVAVVATALAISGCGSGGTTTKAKQVRAAAPAPATTTTTYHTFSGCLADKNTTAEQCNNEFPVDAATIGEGPLATVPTTTTTAPPPPPPTEPPPLNGWGPAEKAELDSALHAHTPAFTQAQIDCAENYIYTHFTPADVEDNSPNAAANGEAAGRACRNA